jgi:murein DD-endopeptidase MepM/ murein hydrolase activator NlpD
VQRLYSLRQMEMTFQQSAASKTTRTTCETPPAMPAPLVNPISLRLIPTSDPVSFRTFPPGTTGLPLLPHPGAFGFQRAHHVHEGVDLYCPPGTAVCAMEAGSVVAVLPFAGAHAGRPWGLNSWVVLLEGASGVFAYGDLKPGVAPGVKLRAGAFVGQVLQVLRDSRGGRPTSMLHLEMHTAGALECPQWMDINTRPATLLDPTPTLLAIAGTGSGPSSTNVTSSRGI